jgi:ABC-type spermidine/putrescine transport system permease subunit II
MMVLAAAAALLFFVVVKVRFDFSGIWAGRTVFVLALALDNLRPQLAKQTHQRPA